MTTTSTPTADSTPAESGSGHGYPASAAVKAEAYWWHLAMLRECATRPGAASRVLSLASAADQIAAALVGTPEAAPDSPRDPVAWTDIATYLTRLALALLGGDMSPGDTWDTSDGDNTDWGNLAATATRQEFAAAWSSIRDNILWLAAPPQEDDGSPQLLRSFTVNQVTRAAAALIDAPW
jgi:hypothetical protein